MKSAIRVVYSGAAGQIGYSLAPRLVNGEAFGADQPIDLVLFDLPVSAEALKGVAMELTDCAFPLLNSLTCSTDPREAYANADYIVMLGAKPRGPGMDRADLLRANGGIFKAQGAAINEVGTTKTRVLVVGNPANTNALICALNAPSIPKENFMALSRLDHNRLIGQLTDRVHVRADAVNDVCIFGNHSNSMVPVYETGTITKDGETKPITEVVADDEWLAGEMTQCVKTRGGAIIKARGRSSAASAASAVIDTLHDWHLGTNGKITSSSIYTDGTHYGIPEGIICSQPLRISAEGKVEVVDGLKLSEATMAAIKATCDELLSEKEQAL